MVILDNFPIWAVYVGLVIIMLAVAEAGFRVGIRLQDRSGNQGESKMTGAVVGGNAEIHPALQQLLARSAPK